MLKSLYAEVDRFEGRSAKPPGPSTAAECYEGSQQALSEAIEHRRIAYQRLSEWRDCNGNIGAALELFDAARREKRKLDPATRAKLDENEVLQTDRRRSELEVEHWRGMVEWWRARDGLGLDRVYGSSASELAAAKGTG